MKFDKKIVKIAQNITDKIASLGWTVDMIVDFGSHSHDEYRADSDYEVNIYVHKEGWIYLFEEYAENLKNHNEVITNWHNEIRTYFGGYKELSGELEIIARTIAKSSTLNPFYVVNIFDTHLLLYNMVHEAWEIFSLVQGSPMVETKTYDQIMEFLKKTKPFHMNFYNTHLNYCNMTIEDANSSLAKIIGVESSEHRRLWLSSITTYLRRLISLLSLLKDGWFLTDKNMILQFIDNYYHDKLILMIAIYYLKCEMSAYTEFLETGRMVTQLTNYDIKKLHEECSDFGNEIIIEIRKLINLDESLESDLWLDSNKLLYLQLPVYKELLDVK